MNRSIRNIETRKMTYCATPFAFRCENDGRWSAQIAAADVCAEWQVGRGMTATSEDVRW